MRKILKLFSPGALFAVFVMSPLMLSPAAAQTTDAQVRAALTAASAEHAGRGYRAAPGVADLVTPLSLEGAYLWPVTLRAGVNYRIFGVCSDACSDVDMEIYGADGNLVDRDAGLNATPFVQIRPAQAGRAYVRIWLASCSAEPCAVGARLVQGGRPEERQAAEPAEPAIGEYEEVVTQQLNSTGAAHRTAGYTALGDDVIAPIRVQSEGYRSMVHLEGGRQYIFQGACDQDCTDVDMELLDAHGASLVSDVAVDNHPVLRYTPVRSGDYFVRLWLSACTVEPCYVGLRSYAHDQ